MEKTLRKVAAAFKLSPDFDSFEQIKMGNVNKTYKISYNKPDGSVKSFILQSINLFVFKNPQQVMHNIDLVTEYIRSRNDGGVSLHFHHVHTKENYYVDETGFWRVINFVESVTFDVCDDIEILRSAGAAFGEFQSALADFDASLLFETIVDFHNTPKRLENLFSDAEKDVAGRVVMVRRELEWFRSVAELASRMQRMLDSGDLPLRVTHNDTKINNVLFDKETNKSLTVIDLDTVMPGLVGHDFGDAVRFACNFVEEDCPDADKAGIDMEKFTALTEGFLSKVKLTQNEIDTLALSCFTITVELASRFLADYINGDVYFRTEYESHNLIRSRCQIALAKDILAHLDEMEAIVKRACGV